MGGSAVASRSLTVAILDDHEVVSEGVRSWCSAATPPIELVHDGADPAGLWSGPGAEADVVILDLLLDDGHDGLAELGRLTQAGRRVVVYTQDAGDATAVRCLDLGALTVVTKSEGRAHLVAAVRKAADGESYTPPALSGAMIADDAPGRPKLSDMEIRSLRAWFVSSSKVLAARSLNIKPRTLDTYIERARIKYAAVGRPAPTKSALVARALEDGLVDLSDLG